MEASEFDSRRSRECNGRSYPQATFRPWAFVSGTGPSGGRVSKWALFCALAGLLAGILSTVLTSLVYWSEDTFHKVPIHWMWWPAIGGLFIGLGGLVFPQALGVGYETIADLIEGDVAGRSSLEY